MLNLGNRVCFFVLALALAGCGQANKTDNAASPDVKAPSRIEQSFSVDAITAPVATAKDTDSSLQLTDKKQILLNPASLDKEFLLQISMISQPVVPMSSGLRSHVVAFHRKGDKLYLMEATQGHTVTHDFPQNLVLAEFPILAEDSKGLLFDFNTGMSRMFVVGDWYATDFDGTDYATDFVTLKTRFSYIEDATLKDNRLTVRQVAALDAESWGVQDNSTMEVRYYLSPYSADTTFEPFRMKDDDFDTIGYFAVKPQLKLDGATVTYASKWNEKKPIVYAVSSNTPAEYKQAVKDGILYWNKIFGEERVQVVDAPVGVTAPDANYNIVQWVKWDQAGFAYADAQMDPRTGEILHSQIYLTSAFAALGKARARLLLKTMNHDVEGQATTGQLRKLLKPSLQGFQKSPLCDFEPGEYWASMLSQLVASGADDARILKLSQDYVRTVTAHEVGHTMGLRHNFAGSLATTYPLAQRGQVFQSYLKDGSAPKGTATTSSIMDYQLTEESVITGDQIAHKEAAYDYDLKAIAQLYKGKTFAKSDVPPFCTDSHAAYSGYADCKRFDTGASAVEYSAWSAADALTSFPRSVAERFVIAKTPLPGEDPEPVQNVYWNPVSRAAAMMKPRSSVFKSLTDSVHFLKVRRQFPYVSELNKDEVREKEAAYVASELERIGGLDNVLTPISDDYADTAFKEFVGLLENQYGSGVGLNGERFEFSSTEKSIMKHVALELFKQTSVNLVKEDLKILGGGGTDTAAPSGLMLLFAPRKAPEPAKLPDNELSRKLADILAARTQRYVFATDDGKDYIAELDVPDTTVKKAEAAKAEAAKTEVVTATVTPTKKVTVVLPQFHYNVDIRTAAAGLLHATPAEALDWGYSQRTKVKKQFDELMKRSMSGSDLTVLKVGEVPNRLAKWALENQKVQGAL